MIKTIISLLFITFMLKKTQRKIKVNKVIKLRLKNYFQKNTFKESSCSIKYSYIRIFIYYKYQK